MAEAIDTQRIERSARVLTAYISALSREFIK